jgi:anti-anti-sigma factor
MSPSHRTPPLAVVRRQDGSGGVTLSLIGELDLHTVELLEGELLRTREASPPGVIDLSELRFLDLIGLRALLRAVEGDVAGRVRLIGASGIVKRLIELAHTIDAKPDATSRAPFPAETTTRLGIHTPVNGFALDSELRLASGVTRDQS